MSSAADAYFMRVALAHARRGVGRVAPNPSVGCVIVKDGTILSAARTSDGGRPHAEANALAACDARGSTAYVTLEPCSHIGKTGPCAQALIDAGVVRVVVACGDPDARVSGRGLKMLEEAGVAVTFGVLETEALVLNAGFFLRITQNRPFVTCKLGTSADHKIAAAAGQRTQITGTLAGRYMHLQRSLHDAIMVGSETFITDAPSLTTRIAGYTHDSTRIVLDGRGRIQDADGFQIMTDTRDIKGVLASLAEQGITRLLVEGGAQLHQSMLDSGFVDQFLHTYSPDIIGKAGVNAPYIGDLETKYGLLKQKTRILGEDTLEIYARTH
jgi:diaminohydroxyphosphoribosylaminopyrimidine deaminase/5-amino-6-(5-phosphoribosylamino)uracil reductase